MFGDAGYETVLRAAGIERAELLITTVPSVSDTRRIVDQARRLNPPLEVMTRAATFEEVHELHAAGVQTVVQPELEASVGIVREALRHLGYGESDLLTAEDTMRGAGDTNPTM